MLGFYRSCPPPRSLARMCNLYSVRASQAELRGLFDVDPSRDRLGNLGPLPAIFPRGDAPVVRLGEEDGDARRGARELATMHWDFPMPQRSKRTGEPILPRAVNNARDDKLASSPFWRESFEHRRCLVPVTAFCEAQGRSPAVHHWFGLATDETEADASARPPFAMAGLWRRWRGDYRGELRELIAHTIVTTTPNALVAPVHPERMVAILPLEDWAAWLDGPPEEALRLIRPFPAERMRVVACGEGLKADR